MKILIADDNANDRLFLRMSLEQFGCEVIEAVDGLDALERAKNTMPDTIVSDALMPRLDGFHLLRALKSDATLKDIPFIFYSATYTGEKENELAAVLGAEAFLVKPKEPPELWEEIKRLIEHFHLKKGTVPRAALIAEDNAFLEKYAQVVTTKLEEKVRELQEANENLRKSEGFIKSVLESVGEGFIVVDSEYRILSANRAYCVQNKLSGQDVIGKRCYEVSHHQNKPCHLAGENCAPKRTFETGEPSFALHEHHDKELRTAFIETRSYPIKDPSGKVVAVIETLNDITEKRSLENQLRHAQRLEAIGILAGGVAHDFNNILTAIIGYTTLMLMTLKEDDPMRQMVKMVLESGERAEQLTKSLLAFSRKQVMKIAAVDLNGLIRNFEKMMRRLIGEDIELRICTSQEPLLTMADTGQIEQVLMNMATNARDAMPKGGSLIITTERTEIDDEFLQVHGYGVPGKYVLMTVSDSGVGMEKTTLEKIFDPFFTTKEVGRGTGLGLAIVYGIIKQHNGFINAYSEPGKGTTFRIYLPLTTAAVHEKEREECVEDLRGSGTILLAEDDGAVRRFTIKALEDFGYRVIEAIDGEDAVSKFEENRGGIDLLLFDIIMPKLDGKAAYDRIALSHPGVRALFMSGYARELIEQKGLLGKETEFIYKPISPTTLLKKMKELLGKG